MEPKKNNNIKDNSSCSSDAVQGQATKLLFSPVSNKRKLSNLYTRECLWPVDLNSARDVVGFTFNREIYSHAYGKWQMSDSRWEFQKMENEKIKTLQNHSYE